MNLFKFNRFMFFFICIVMNRWDFSKCIINMGGNIFWGKDSYYYEEVDVFFLCNFVGFE